MPAAGAPSVSAEGPHRGVGHPVLGVPVEPVGDGAVEVVVASCGSCGRPCRDVGPGSSVGVERRAHLPEPAVQAGLGVPNGIRSVSATSGSGRSR